MVGMFDCLYYRVQLKTGRSKACGGMGFLTQYDKMDIGN